MAYWMHESDGQEAYQEMDTLVLETGVSESTIRRARNYLVETAWLIRLEGSAGSRYTKASSGAWNIGVYRVNDPTSVKLTELEGESVKMTEGVGQNDRVGGVGQIDNPVKLTPNVASTGTAAFTGTTTVSSPATDTLATPHTPCVRERLAPPITSLREEKPEHPPTGTKPEEPRRSRMEQIEARSEFWSKHYTESPSMAFFTFNEDQQTYWIIGHTRHKEDPLAPSIGKYRCPACEFTTSNSDALVRHLPAEHKETLRRLYE
jgi:hypothetical protein